MRRRSKARECALQLLYQGEINHQDPIDSAEDYWSQIADQPRAEEISDEVREFTRRIVTLVREHEKEIDEEIRRAAEHWKMERMAVVDKNVLRIGVSEILYCDDIPDKVAINEAIELAKKFGDADSSRFVNGVLDHIAKNHESR